MTNTPKGHLYALIFFTQSPYLFYFLEDEIITELLIQPAFIFETYGIR